MSVLIAGSVAYDTILTYPGRFSDRLLPGELDHINLTFHATTMSRHHGGCAANIAYGMRQLGAIPIVAGALGHDGAEYLQRFCALGIETRIVTDPAIYSSQCFITTDADGAQMATFIDGAMQTVEHLPLGDTSMLSFVSISPGAKAPMLALAQDCAEASLPCVFDPGQAISLFSPLELHDFCRQAFLTIVSDYEAAHLRDKADITPEWIMNQGNRVIITHGRQGASLFDSHLKHAFSACPASAVDPVGAGDAFRAGLFSVLDVSDDWFVAMQVACALAATKVEHAGPQSYRTTRTAILERASSAFGATVRF